MPARGPFRKIPVRLLWIAAATALTAGASTAVRSRLLIPVQADSRVDQLAAGKILVARRSLLDPNFAKTVILLVQYDEDGTVGLILNRQTKIPLSRLAPDLESAKGRADPLYLGGPVAPNAMMGLLRGRTKLEDAERVMAGVYMVSSKAMLEKAMAARTDPGTFRLYMGYAGWAAEQLEWEIGQDAWDVLPADAGIVFDAHPESLWPRLIEREDQQMAQQQITPSTPLCPCASRSMEPPEQFRTRPDPSKPPPTFAAVLDHRFPSTGNTGRNSLPPSYRCT